MKRAFFFDVDDTLCATGTLHAKAFLDTFSQLGIGVPHFIYSDFIGLSTEEIFKELIEDTKTIKVATALKRQIFRNSIGEILPNEGAVEILRYLSREKLRIIAVSSGSIGSVQATLNATGLKKWIDEVITCESTTRAKPYPDPYILAINKSGCDPIHCLAIEDSEVGVQSAVAAKIETVLISRDPSPWAKKYPVIRFESLTDLKISLEQSL